MNDAHVHDDGRHDFDFFHGRWQLRNERLKRRLVGSDDWEIFDATQACRPILGGLGNIDDFITDWDGGFIGMSLRLFNPRTRQWSIYWAGHHTGLLEAPVVGRFENGVGTFLGHDLHEGRAVLQRFIWSEITATSALWQQALSIDDGQRWETNWYMRMRRSA